MLHADRSRIADWPLVTEYKLHIARDYARMAGTSKGDLMLSTLTLSLRSLVNAILGKVPGKPGRLDAATRMAMDAEPASFAALAAKASAEPKGSPRRDEPEVQKVDPIDELKRIIGNPSDSDSLRPRTTPRGHERRRRG